MTIRITTFVSLLFFCLGANAQNIVLVATPPDSLIQTSRYINRLFKKQGYNKNEGRKMLMKNIYDVLAFPINELSTEQLVSDENFIGKKLKTEGTRTFYKGKKKKPYHDGHTQLVLGETAMEYLKLNAKGRDCKYIAVVHSVSLHTSLLRRLFIASSEKFTASVDVYDLDMKLVYKETITKKMRLTSDMNSDALKYAIKTMANDISLLLGEVAIDRR